MITRDELQEIENVLRDYRMALDFLESMNQDAPFVVLPTKEPISIVFDEAKKQEVNTKVADLEKELKKRLAELSK